MIRRLIALAATASALAFSTALPATAAPAPASVKPASVSISAPTMHLSEAFAVHETVRPNSKASGPIVRPMVTYDGIHTIDGNFPVDNSEDWDVDVTWYWDTNECGTPSNYCWVPKYVQTFYPGAPSCTFNRLDADFVQGGGGGSLIQRIANTSSGSTAPVATFTTGAWTFDSQDPRVNAKLTQNGGIGTGCGEVTHTTVRN